MSLLKRVGIMLLLICAGCNLSRTEVSIVATDPPAITEAPASTETSAPRSTRTPIPFGNTPVGTSDGVLPTLLPLPDGGNVTVSTPQPSLVPVTSVPLLNASCQTYTTFSGADPRNSLSLRSSASITAPQVFRVPTNTQVLLVPGSQETEGDGYHWLNIIYVGKETRYVGWMARDSFSTNGVRDASVATLRPLGTTAAC